MRSFVGEKTKLTGACSINIYLKFAVTITSYWACTGQGGVVFTAPVSFSRQWLGTQEQSWVHAHRRGF